MFTKIRILFVVLCGLSTIPALAMESAAAPAGSRSVPLIDGKYTHKRALEIAIRWADIECIEVLLADPATPISNPQENSDNLITVMLNGMGQPDPSNDNRIMKMLLFFGFDPTYKQPYSKSALETAQEFCGLCPDYFKWMTDYKNIEKHCTPKELIEFASIKKERMGITHAKIMLREIGGLHVKKIASKKPSAKTISVQTAAAQAESAAAPKVTKPCTKDTKENSK